MDAGAGDCGDDLKMSIVVGVDLSSKGTFHQRSGRGMGIHWVAVWVKSPRSEIASGESQGTSICEIPRTLRKLVFLEQILYLILSFFTSNMFFFFL